MPTAFQTRCGTCPPCGGPCVSNLPITRTGVGKATFPTHGYPAFDPNGVIRSAVAIIPWKQQAALVNGLPALRDFGHSTQNPQICRGDRAEIGSMSADYIYTPGGQFTATEDFSVAGSPATDARWSPAAESGQAGYYYVENPPYGPGWYVLEVQRGQFVGGRVCRTSGSYRGGVQPTYGNTAPPNFGVVAQNPVVTPPPDGLLYDWVGRRFKTWKETTRVNLTRIYLFIRAAGEPGDFYESPVSQTQEGRFVQQWEITAKRRKPVWSVVEDQPLEIASPPATLPNPLDPAYPLQLVGTVNLISDPIIFCAPSGEAASITSQQQTWNSGGISLVYASYESERPPEGGPPFYTGQILFDYSTKFTVEVGSELLPDDWANAATDLTESMPINPPSASVMGYVGDYWANGEAHLRLASQSAGQWNVQRSVIAGPVLPWENVIIAIREVSEKTITGWQNRWLTQFVLPGVPQTCPGGYIKRKTTERLLWLVDESGAVTGTIPHHHGGTMLVDLAPMPWRPRRLRHSQSDEGPLGPPTCCPP